MCFLTLGAGFVCHFVFVDFFRAGHRFVCQWFAPCIFSLACCRFCYFWLKIWTTGLVYCARVSYQRKALFYDYSQISITSISYFPYFKFVTFKTRVILCYTLRKEGRAFRNIGKYIPILCNQPYLFSCRITWPVHRRLSVVGPVPPRCFSRSPFFSLVPN